MTLPREIKLVDMNGSPVVSTSVVKELDNIAGEWTSAVNGICNGGDAYEMVVSLNPKDNSSFTVGNAVGEKVNIQVNPLAGKVIMSRTSSSGAVSFHGMFSIPSMSAPYDKNAETLDLHIYVDDSSVELLSEDGKTAMTCLVFPTEPYDRITGVDEVAYRPLKSIWR